MNGRRVQYACAAPLILSPVPPLAWLRHSCGTWRHWALFRQVSTPRRVPKDQEVVTPRLEARASKSRLIEEEEIQGEIEYLTLMPRGGIAGVPSRSRRLSKQSNPPSQRNGTQRVLCVFWGRTWIAELIKKERRPSQGGKFIEQGNRSRRRRYRARRTHLQGWMRFDYRRRKDTWSAYGHATW